MLAPCLDYRTLLREELVKRCRANPRYSANAMARDMGLSACFFSQLISGKRPLNETRAFAMAKKLRWGTPKTKLFTTLVRYALATDGDMQREILAELKVLGRSKELSFFQVGLDQFSFISDWYHNAILELMAVENFQPRPDWIAMRLGILGRKHGPPSAV